LAVLGAVTGILCGRIVVIGDCTSPSFDGGGNYEVGEESSSVISGDFNRDGKLDLAVAKWGVHQSITNGTVSVLLGNGDGTFQAATNYRLGTVCYCVATGDFNRDGILDLAIGCIGVRLMLGHGDGTFGPAVSVEPGPIVPYLAVADFNRDGKLDLMTANNDTGNISVLLGNGDGTFQPPLNHPATAQPQYITVGDFNGDGKPDAAVASASNVSSIMLGNGDGTFRSAPDYNTGSGQLSVTTSDFNGDGKPDLAVGNVGLVSVGLGNGNGTFQPPINFGIQDQHWSIAAGDFNGDGIPDLAVGGTGDYVSIHLGNGNGTFGGWNNFDAALYPFSIAVADLNGDGKPDIATANYNSTNASVLLNTSPCAGPALAVKSALSTIELSWSYPSTDFALQGTPSLSAPDWQPVTEPRTTNILTLEVSVPVDRSQSYFRLRKP
jgi:hypothetical protein